MSVNGGRASDSGGDGVSVNGGTDRGAEATGQTKGIFL